MGSLWYLIVFILPCCSPFVFHSFHKSSWTLSSSTNADPYESFSAFDRLLFNRFSDSVYNELSTPVNSTRTNKYNKAADNYRDLIEMINYMTHSRPIKQVNKQGTNMLVKLFPPGLLPTYKLTFAKFPKFSAWMNTWVTYYTTQWLMGKSKVEDLIINNDGVVTIQKENLLVIEKCRFLETSKCVKTCIHACKLPTQNFFYDEMGLPVSLQPNLTDYSCKFEFGKLPIPLEKDEISNAPCILDCSSKNNRENCMVTS